MDKTLIGLARDKRKNPTEAEAVMWQLLRRHFNGMHFRRQYPIAGFIADFACTKEKLIIEVDGGYHFTDEQAINDKTRTVV